MIELQTAIFEKLSSDVTLQGLLSSYTYSNGQTVPSVFTHLPQSDDNAVFPCIVIDYPKLNQNDTDTTIGFDCTLLIHSWSVERTFKQCADIQTALYNSLHRATLTISSFKFSGISCEFNEILLDPDGISRHGIQRFRIFIEQG